MDQFQHQAHLITWEVRAAFPALLNPDIAAIVAVASASTLFATGQEDPEDETCGYFHWTGARKDAFQAWSKMRGVNPWEPPANIGFLIYELQTTHAIALVKVARASSLRDKVVAFGVAYASGAAREAVDNAQRALDALPPSRKVPDELAVLPAPRPKPLARSTTIWAQCIMVLLAFAAMGAHYRGVAEASHMYFVIGVSALACAAWTIRERIEKA